MASDDGFRPFNWGLHSIELDRGVIADGIVSLRSCEARFRDGTKLSIPNDCIVDPVDIRNELAGCGSVTVYLAIAELHSSLATVKTIHTTVGPAPTKFDSNEI